MPLFDSACDFLFNDCVIGCAGKLYPCCFCADEKSSFGDLHKQSFGEIWSGITYQSARNLFLCNKCPANKVITICDACRNYRKQPDNDNG